MVVPHFQVHCESQGSAVVVVGAVVVVEVDVSSPTHSQSLCVVSPSMVPGSPPLADSYRQLQAPTLQDPSQVLLSKIQRLEPTLQCQ